MEQIGSWFLLHVDEKDRYLKSTTVLILMNGHSLCNPCQPLGALFWVFKQQRVFPCLVRFLGCLGGVFAPHGFLANDLTYLAPYSG